MLAHNPRYVAASNKYVTKSTNGACHGRGCAFQQHNSTAANPAQKITLGGFDTPVAAERLVECLRDQQSLAGFGPCAERGAQQRPRLEQGGLKRCRVPAERGGARACV